SEGSRAGSRSKGAGGPALALFARALAAGEASDDSFLSAPTVPAEAAKPAFNRLRRVNRSMGSSESAEYTATAIQSAGKVHATAALKHTSGHSVVTFAYCHSILLRLAKFGDAQLGSAGVSPAVAWASLCFAQGRLCPRVCWGGTPLQLRPGRPRYIKQCHPI